MQGVLDRRYRRICEIRQAARRRARGLAEENNVPPKLKQQTKTELYEEWANKGKENNNMCMMAITGFAELQQSSNDEEDEVDREEENEFEFDSYTLSDFSLPKHRHEESSQTTTHRFESLLPPIPQEIESNLSDFEKMLEEDLVTPMGRDISTSSNLLSDLDSDYRPREQTAIVENELSDESSLDFREFLHTSKIAKTTLALMKENGETDSLSPFQVPGAALKNPTSCGQKSNDPNMFFDPYAPSIEIPPKSACRVCSVTMGTPPKHQCVNSTSNQMQQQGRLPLDLNFVSCPDQAMQLAMESSVESYQFDAPSL